MVRSRAQGTLERARTARLAAALFFAALAVLLLCGPAAALSIRITLPELSTGSPVVVRGSVEKIESAWTTERVIESTAYVSVTDALRGNVAVGELIQVRVLGGRVGRITQVTTDEPTFETGEEVLLFLTGPDGDAYRVTEGWQGEFEVVGDKAINQAWQEAFPLADLGAGVREGRWPDETATPGPSSRVILGDYEAALRDGGAAKVAEPDDYVLNGQKWPGLNPMEGVYVVNINTGDAGGANGSVEDFRNAMIQAANSWSNAGAHFAFHYGGPSSIAVSDFDGYNVLHWETWQTTSVLAQSSWWFSDTDIFEADIRFNDHWPWDATGTPSSSEPDLQSVAVHELGHWLSLGHDTQPYCSTGGPVMCAAIQLGTLRRTLHANDIAGIRAIYGVGGPAAIGDLHVAKAGSDAKLTWTIPATNDSTRVLSSDTNPYFAPAAGTDRGIVAAPTATWSDTGILGDTTATTRYYVVLGRAGGAESGPSSSVGAFEFKLARGQ